MEMEIKGMAEGSLSVRFVNMQWKILSILLHFIYSSHPSFTKK